MSAVAVDGVWKFYGDYPALRDVRLASRSRRLPGADRPQRRRQDHPAAHRRRLFAARPRADPNLRHGAAGNRHAPPNRLHRPRHLGLRRAFGARKSDAVRAGSTACADPQQLGHGMAGAHRSGARPQRPGARVLARHAAAPGGGARLSPRSRRAAARRAVHRARRPRHRRPAAPAARGAGGRQDHRHVHPPVAGSAGAGLARRAAERAARWPFTARARRKWSPTPATSTRATARAASGASSGRSWWSRSRICAPSCAPRKPSTRRWPSPW